MTSRRAFFEITEEYERAAKKFPKFHSAHEGYSVILEELDELWEEVKKNGSERSQERLRKETIQVAAMAMRFLIDIC